MEIKPTAFILVSLFTMSRGDIQNCTTNEYFTNCGTACEPTCQNPEPQICSDHCVAGCFCQKGYIRQRSRGRCVETCKRPPQCPKNEVFNICGTPCPPTCLGPKTAMCINSCVAGCFCQGGYIREYRGGRCVPSCTSPTECPENEVFMECGTACEPTLQNPKPGVCTQQCVVGCFCQKGYIRDSLGGKCVPSCNENEVFSDCVSCPAFCNQTENMICPLYCRSGSGCDCEDFYVRRSRSDGRCIPQVSCKTECDKNEVYKKCGTLCPGTCSEPVKVCSKKCASGCFCKDGYILNDVTRECILACDCPK